MPYGFGRRAKPAFPSNGPVRVGFFGLHGSGNIGNDGSLEAMLGLLEAEFPEVLVGCLCSGPDAVARRYGIPATRMQWVPEHKLVTSRVGMSGCKVTGKVVDAFRTLRWVRRFDAVIVPGTGVLETTLPLRPWGFPYALFLLCACGKLAGTKVALVNVGANITTKRLTRLLFIASTRMAHYRSYRDTTSTDAVREMGGKAPQSSVYPDLTFALPLPAAPPAVPGTVGVGVMDFHGSNDDRKTAEVIHSSYVNSMKEFIRWLVDTDHRVRIFVGDHVDNLVAAEIRSAVLADRPGLDPSAIVAQPISSLAELMTHMAPVDTVVATRYHNMICALKLAKPVLSVSYSTKSDDAMARWGLARFCHSARDIHVARLTEQFTELENRAAELRDAMGEHTSAQERLLRQQLAVLSRTLFGELPLQHSAPSTVREFS